MLKKSFYAIRLNLKANEYPELFGDGAIAALLSLTASHFAELLVLTQYVSSSSSEDATVTGHYYSVVVKSHVVKEPDPSAASVQWTADITNEGVHVAKTLEGDCAIILNPFVLGLSSLFPDVSKHLKNQVSRFYTQLSKFLGQETYHQLVSATELEFGDNKALERVISQTAMAEFKVAPICSRNDYGYSRYGVLLNPLSFLSKKNRLTVVEFEVVQTFISVSGPVDALTKANEVWVYKDSFIRDACHGFEWKYLPVEKDRPAVLAREVAQIDLIETTNGDSLAMPYAVFIEDAFEFLLSKDDVDMNMIEEMVEEVNVALNEYSEGLYFDEDTRTIQRRDESFALPA